MPRAGGADLAAAGSGAASALSANTTMNSEARARSFSIEHILFVVSDDEYTRFIALTALRSGRYSLRHDRIAAVVCFLCRVQPWVTISIFSSSAPARAACAPRASRRATARGS